MLPGDRCLPSPYSTQYGYIANDTMFKGKDGTPISQETYKAEISTPAWDDKEVLKSVTDHIVGGWKSDSDTQSKWISTTLSHEWVVWETARRLISNRVGEVCVTSIVDRRAYSPRYRGTRMIGVDASGYLSERGYEMSDKCVRFAESSSEKLWYGRIFPKDISGVEYWTSDVSPCLIWNTHTLL